MRLCSFLPLFVITVSVCRRVSFTRPEFSLAQLQPGTHYSIQVSGDWPRPVT